eukprot:CAMPEP_0206489312 /NCGR_PEP_ID=MMETSP0324_2-20121206/43138_1 /ASSEMBLY_ACC=CAM_ASM_000836 /TAXON_ID=2866 /ORGANISM="Crypthecodinium cohnii, Strain Seligo" /LENGTH=98 /DNA_ID=CAMNT_0053968913 /DNA_START=436 /DNA_END=729 /DNA_ORIENTATION=-
MTTTTATTNDGKGATQLERAPGGSARSGGLHAEAFSAFCGRFMEMGGRATRIEAEAAAADGTGEGLLLEVGVGIGGVSNQDKGTAHQKGGGKSRQPGG